MLLEKKALADPTVQKAVTSLKQNSFKAGTGAINKELGKIAPQPKSPDPLVKIIKYVKKAKKGAHLPNTIKKGNKKKTPQPAGKKIFNTF